MKIYILIIMLMAAAFAYAQPYSTVTSNGITFNYRVTQDLQNLDCQLIAATTGWVAVGFDPGNQMQNANFIIGYHSMGNTFIRDDFGATQTSHVSDISLGGTDNILISSSTEEGGVTQLNFTIPLDSGDAFDKDLAIGQAYDIILGRGSNGADNYTSFHAGIGSASITITQPVAAIDDVIVQPAADFSLVIVPNPFSSSLGIRTDSKAASPLTVTVYDSKGREINRVTAVANSEINLNSQNYPAGIYYIKAVGNGSSVMGKALKLR